MSHKRQLLIGLVLGGLAILGLTGAAFAQAGSQAAAKQQYDQKLKTLDRNNADALVALAKWCYVNGLMGEAMTNAIEANQKAPEDLRAKYLIFALTSANGGGTAVTGTGGDVEVTHSAKAVTIADAAVDKLYKQDPEALKQFKTILPLMQQRCGAPSCHGGAKAKWSFITRNMNDRRVMADNFQAIYPYLNRDKQEDSRFLQLPTKGPEAGHPTQAIRTPTDPAYKIILNWIKTVNSDATKVLPWGKK